MEPHAVASPCKLFVGGLSGQTTSEMLRGHFEQYGRLVDFVVMVQQGRPKGFGFVTYELPHCAAAALANAHWLGERYVDVKPAVPGDQKAPDFQRSCPGPSSHLSQQHHKMFVGGLPQECTAADLRRAFAGYGPIADVVVMMDQKTKRSRGFGFVHFAAGEQGFRAAEAVLQEGSSRWLGGKWVEVKRAAPAYLLQDLSPGSATACSPAHSPAHAWQQQQQQQTYQQDEHILAPWLGSASPGGALSNSRERLRQRGRCFALGDPASPYGDQWGAIAMPEAFAGYGGMAPWEQASPLGRGQPLSPLSSCSPMSPPPQRGLAPAVVLGLTPAARSPAGAGSPLATSPPSGAHLRVQTPPPTARCRALAKGTPPPGLGPWASPMKVECRTSCFEGLALEDGLLKVMPLQQAC